MKESRRVRRAFGVALPAALLAANVWGARFVVSTTADGDDRSAGDGTCRTAAGQCTLRAAIEEANALHVSDPDVITLPAGTYTLSQSELHITDDLTINGARAATTIIQAAPNARVLHTEDTAPGDGRRIVVTLNRLTIEGGKAFTGGGLQNEGAQVNGSHLVVRKNHSVAEGGGIHNSAGGGMFLSDCTIDSNICDARGGGIDNRSDSSMELHRCTLSRNQANLGGGMRNASATVTFSDCTISGNTVSHQGGGILNLGVIFLTDSTIADNHAGTEGGGGIWSDPTPTPVPGGTTRAGAFLFNSILARNTRAVGGTGPDCVGIAIINPGLLGNGNGCTIGNSPSDLDKVLVGTNNNPIDPLLGPLGSNGGPTETQALLSGSPAIDPSVGVCFNGVDQRSAPRPFDGNGDGTARCDFGAYEAGATPPPDPRAVLRQLGGSPKATQGSCSRERPARLRPVHEP